MLRCCCSESSEAESGEYLRMVSAATLLAGGRATTIARAAVGGVVWCERGSGYGWRRRSGYVLRVLVLGRV